MTSYIAIGGGYQYAPLHAGVALMAPDGREVYFQPGDDAAAFYATLEALDEVPEARLAVITDMSFGDYFA